MERQPVADVQASNYQVKNVEPVMIGTDVRARLFTLASEDVIPWHSHSKTEDHYFVLQGELTVSTRLPEQIQAVGAGRDYRIPPGRPHLIANRSAADCRFLLLQGVGRVDWVKATE